MASVDEMPSGERGIETPIAKPRPGQPGQPGQPERPEGPGETKGIVEPLTLFGRNFEAAHLGDGLKDSMAGMLRTILSSPQGLAFLDPEQNTSFFKNNHLEAIKYLYLQGVGSPKEVAKEADKLISRKSKDRRLRRKRNSAYYNRVKKYRRNPGPWRRQLRDAAKKWENRGLKTESSKFFTQKIYKTC